MQSSTSAQVWVRIYGLEQEYWRPKILFAIASSIGTPIFTNYASTKPRIERTFGHFDRVLVDIDVSQVPRYKVLVERKDYAFFVEFKFEDMPGFCSYCKKVKHYIDESKHANKTVEEKQCGKSNERKTRIKNGVCYEERWKNGTGEPTGKPYLG